MSKQFEERQFIWEIKDYVYNVAPYLPSGGSISSQAATLTSPAGVETTLSPAPTRSGAVVTAVVDGADLTPTTGAERWVLAVKCTLSNGEVHGPEFLITVLE